ANDVRQVPHGYFLLRVDRCLDASEIQVRQGERVLWRQRYRELVPARSIHLAAGWLAAVAPDGGELTVKIASR
ncbi:MAG: hypothetical protein ABIR79_10740, partial [Candidatus Binatia bacterium]